MRLLHKPLLLLTLMGLMAGCRQDSGATGNRLAKETSPYLLQHAGNPVHWQPWEENVWKDKMKELGGQYLLWSNAPENPSLN